MTRKEAADYLRPIMENANDVPKLQAALVLAVEALEGREVPALQGDKKLGKGQRLTYQLGEYWQIKGAGGAPCDVVCDSRGLSGCHDCPIQTAFDHLAAYENTMPFERAQDLAQAEKDGRLVVLPPIKIGDTAFFIINKRIYEGKVYYMRWEHHKSFGVRGNISADLYGGCVGAGLFDFGKTVFLTREEAEAALKKREAEDDEAD